MDVHVQSYRACGNAAHYIQYNIRHDMHPRIVVTHYDKGEHCTTHNNNNNNDNN